MDLGKKLAEGFALDAEVDALHAVVADASGIPVPDTADPPPVQEPVVPATV